MNSELPLPLPTTESSNRRARLLPATLLTRVGLIVAVFFVAIAPTLPWPQFSGDSEDLVVQTVLQMRNGGPWWIPMLGDQPRSKKPPLPAWIAAAAASRATVRNLASTDQQMRESSYRQLAWQVRWPSLLAACGMMLAVAALAQFVGGPAHVVPSILIFGSSLIVLRFTRSATTDVYLALWVIVANAFLAAAVLRNRVWIGCLGAGAALGLALMCKGPVAFVETLLPFAVFLLLRKRPHTETPRSPLAPSRKITAPLTCALVLMLAIALPWPISVYLRNPHTLSTWLTEIDRQGAAVVSHAGWYAYLSLLPNLLPWLPIFIAGIYLLIRNFHARKPINLALLLTIVPIVFLSLFPDRKERYLLPMAGPAAILAGHASTRMKRAFPPSKFLEKLVWISYWAILLVMAVGVPIAAGLLLKDRDGKSCCSPAIEAASLIVGCAIFIAGIVRQSHSRESFLFAGAALMLLLNAFFIGTWSRSVQGLSEMKPLADRLHASFPGQRIVYFDPPPDGKPVTLDLDIYLDQPVPVLAQMPPADGSTAAVVLLGKGSEPTPAVPGWSIWCDLTSRNHHWFILTPSR